MSFKPSDLVLVTGANGHVGQHVVNHLLTIPNGPRIRASVRSESSAAQLKSFYAGLISKGRLSFAYVPDMTTDAAFDKAVEGATHIVHVASPLIIGAEDVANELLNPAIKGMTGILKSAVKEKSVKSVVITSSFGSAFDPKHGLRPGYTYSPNDWNPISFDEAASPDLDLTAWEELWRPYITYMASKVLAEKAAFDFIEEHKPNWQFSSILPTYVGGPYVLPLAKGKDSISFSVGLIWKAATGPGLPVQDFPYWVDVRDCAKAHVEALLRPEAAGKRFILAPIGTTYTAMADIVRQHYPAFNPSREQQDVDF